MNMLTLSSLATVTPPVAPHPVVCTAVLDTADRTLLCSRLDAHGHGEHHDDLYRVTF